MIDQFPIHATVAASDLKRARAWYADKLGLTPEQEDGGLWFRFEGDTWLLVYETESAGTAKNTVAGWTVKDIESVMAKLRERGVEFEEYDMPGMKTENGLATFETAKTAWFKDSEGNTFELSETLGT
ncbi:MAG TPA: VOC family protein [Candidatus Limnocylindria bacterium]|nr:VOC family protein [Candidatus Limnocylindria bacterium]